MNLTQAATALGYAPETLRRMLRQSDRGELVIRGEQVVIDYTQGGRKGQGRITLEEKEIDRLKQCMKPSLLIEVKPRPYRKQIQFPVSQHITVVPGRPD